MPKSELIKALEINGTRLTLATWESMGLTSMEIGIRNGDNFNLLQFRMNGEKALDIVSRLVAKGKTPNKIQRIFERLEG